MGGCTSGHVRRPQEKELTSNVKKNNDKTYPGSRSLLEQHQQKDNHYLGDKENQKQTFMVSIRKNEQLPAIPGESDGDNNLQQRRTDMEEDNKIHATSTARKYLRDELQLARNYVSVEAKKNEPFPSDKKDIFFSEPERVQICTSNRKTEKSMQFSAVKSMKNAQTQTFDIKTNENVQSQADRKTNEDVQVQTVKRKTCESLQTQSSVGKATKNVQTQTVNGKTSKSVQTQTTEIVAENKCLLLKNSEFEEKIGKLQKDIEKKDIQLRTLQTSYDSRKQEKKKGERQKSLYEDEKTRMRSNLEIHQRENQNLKSDLRVCKDELKSVKSIKDKVTEELEIIRQANQTVATDRNAQIMPLRRENSALSSTVAKLEHTISALEKQLRESNDELKTVKSNNTRLTRQSEKSQEEYNQTRTSLGEQIVLLRGNCTTLSSTVEKLQQKESVLETQIGAREEELKIEQLNKDRVTKELETLQQEYYTTRTDLEKQIVSVRGDNSVLLSRVENFQQNISVLKSQLGDCEDELNIVLSNKAKLSEELEILQQEYQTSRTDLEKQIVSIKGDNIALLSTLKKQQRNIAMMERQLDEEYKESRRLHREAGLIDMMEIPWRDEPIFDKKYLQNLKEEVECYWPLRDMGVAEDALRHVNILFVGPIGAGKSSFINSVESAFRGYVTMTAGAGSRSKSLTSMYHQYQILSSDNRHPMKFQLCDCRGLEDRNSISRDIDSILEGHIPDNYVFNTSFPMISNMKGYKTCPRLENKIHCVVFVLDASTYSADFGIPFVSEPVRKIVNAIQESVDQKGIPQLAILNKVDSVCKSTCQDTSLVFRSPVIRQRCIDAAGFLGVPPMMVLPMKNYTLETSSTDDISILALYNIRQMLQAADTFLRVHYLSTLRDNMHD